MNTLPVGIQNFPMLRERGYVYVDKIMLTQLLLESDGYFFLSRPMRFGKSLLVSTLKTIYDGRKDLSAGLWLEDQHNFAVQAWCSAGSKRCLSCEQRRRVESLR